MLKRGRLHEDEKNFISLNAGTMTVEAIAKHLNRSRETVEEVILSRGMLPVLPPDEMARPSEAMADSQKWKRLRDELTPEEFLLFREEYAALVGQFRNDVLPSEQTQIFDCIKFEILKSRNMVERQRARTEISRLEKAQRAFLGRFTQPGSMQDADRSFALQLETQLVAARAAEQSKTTEYVKLQERHDALMKSLKGQRDQRIREIESGNESILGLLKKLQRDQFAASEGRQMELMKMAARKEYERLGRLHQYEDGSADRPILSPETLDLGDEEDLETGVQSAAPEDDDD